MDDPDSTHPRQASKPTKKRKRTAHACEPCRHRKSRCDGTRPKCDMCDEQGAACYYRDVVAMTAVRLDQQPIAHLEARLRDMERMLHSLVPNGASQNLSPASSARIDSQLGAAQQSPVDNRVGDAGFQVANQLDVTSNRDSGVWPARPDDSVDGMGSITFVGETCSGVFGPTSNSAFLQKIISAQYLIFGQGQSQTSSLDDFHTATSLDISRPASPPPQSCTWWNAQSPAAVNPYILPSQHDTQQLVDVFFENTGKFFPYLYKPHILRNITNMRRSGFQNVERSKLCVLNLLMAFATSHCPSDLPVSVKAERGDVFLQRALRLIPDIKPGTGNLDSIQALLMATQYIQGTQGSSQTWNVLGTLIHAAFQVGLYQQATQVHDSPLDAELRKRTWWMCFIMDRMCSMTFGRPQLVPNGYMTLDLPTDVELEALDGGLPDHGNVSATSTPSLLLHTSQLYLILGSIIEAVYANNIPGPTHTASLHHVLRKVLEAEEDLTKWLQGLPQTLPLVTALELDRLHSIEDLQTYRFRTILTLRYLNVRTLLHRAVLSHVLESKSREPHADFALNSSANCINSCMEAAVETIGIILHANHKQDLLPIWWYSVYFSFSSALAVYGGILAIYRRDIRTYRYSPLELVQTLRTAQDVLEKLGGETRQVLRCRKIVRRLLKAASALYPQSKAGTGPENETNDHEEPHQIPSDESLDLFDGSFIRGGLGSDIALDLSTFTDELGSLIPDTFPL